MMTMMMIVLVFFLYNKPIHGNGSVFSLFFFACFFAGFEC